MLYDNQRQYLIAALRRTLSQHSVVHVLTDNNKSCIIIHSLTLLSNNCRAFARKAFKMLSNVFGTSSRKSTSIKCCVSCETISSVSIYFGSVYFKIICFIVKNCAYHSFAVSVVLLTALFWIPASTTISYVDRKKRRNDAKEYKWNQSLDLIHPSDRRRVIHIR